MAKAMLAAVVATLAMSGVSASAQSGAGGIAPELDAPRPGQLLNKDYVTGSGETVQRPGVPQGSGPTPLDRSIERKDNAIENSICSNCDTPGRARR
jgi:hypothetical protein